METDLKRTWDAALGDIQLQLTRATFDTWMKGTELVGREDDCYIISTPSPYAVEWLENRLQRMIKQTLERHIGESVVLKFVVRTAAASEAQERRSAVARAVTHANGSSSAVSPPVPTHTPIAATETPERILPTTPLVASVTPTPTVVTPNPYQERYSFDTYVVGPSNRLAHAAAVAVAERPAVAYNPLFIYGGGRVGQNPLVVSH